MFQQTGRDDDRRAVGVFSATGLRPHCMERLEALGAGLSMDLFRRRLMPSRTVRLERRATLVVAPRAGD